MKRKLSALFVCLFLIASAACAADITGAWQFERTGPNGMRFIGYYVFKADGNKFTGRMITSGDQREIVNGVVDGDQVTFEVKPWVGTGRNQVFKGELKGEELTFSPVAQPRGPGAMPARAGVPGTPPPAGAAAAPARAPRAPMVTTLRRTSASTEFNPPAELAPRHKPLPDFKPIPANGLAKTPPMGWNSWNKFNRKIDDKTVREIADAMVSSGMKDAGYLYVNIDDTWEAKRDAEGKILTNEKFPDMKALADYVHSKGLKIGIYSGPGPRTCAQFEGSYLHEEQDAKSFAAWGIDYLKYDWCSATAVYRPDEMRGAYQKMALALRATGRPIVYSLCQYGWLDVGEWGGAAGGNLWRTTGDIRDQWQSMANIGFNQNGREKFAGPGRWNDPDMLEIGNGGMTDTEYRTHMSLWCMLAAPLLAGNDLRSMSKETIEILTNREVIAIDQDKLGAQGLRVKQDGELEVWKKPLAKGVAVALFNRSGAPAKMGVKWPEVGVNKKNPKVRDLWAHTDIKAKGEYSVEVPSHGVVMLRVQ